MEHFEYVIIGSGPAGLGAAFELLDCGEKDILIIDQERYCSGGLRNDCKMNFSSRIGFTDSWTDTQINYYLEKVKRRLQPTIFPKSNIEIYQKRAEKLSCELAVVEQTHLGTDGGLELIKKLYQELEDRGVKFLLGRKVLKVEEKCIRTVDLFNITYDTIKFDKLLIAPGRKGFKFLQEVMDYHNISYVDNVVDVGLRIETKEEHYPIVRDYYDPKFYFPNKVRTFCTNSGNAHVVQEKYEDDNDNIYYSVNGHAFKEAGNKNNLVNFAILKTVKLTEPLASGSKYAESLGLEAALLGGGKPIMQRVGDFRLGHRSKAETFVDSDLYNFKPTLNATPGDISLVCPAKILRDIWSAMKNLDTIIPGVLHPSTIMYYPEIKFYANKPQFIDDYFRAKNNIWLAGDGAGTSRGITAAWASGIRAAEGMIR